MTSSNRSTPLGKGFQSFLGKNYIILNDRYLLGEKLGTQGRYEVFKGVDIYENHRQLAIKKLPDPDQHEAKRFHQEFETLAKIEQPDIIKAYDYLEHGNNLFILLEFAEGTTLQELLDEQVSFSWPEKIAIANRIARAVEVIHLAGVQHQALQPNNIVINAQTGTVKLLSLGAQPHSLERIAEEQKACYVASYLSGEQAQGNVASNSDIFSLATLFYQFFLNTSHSPFYAENFEQVLKNLQYHHPVSLWEKIQEQAREENSKLSEAQQKFFQELSELLQHAWKKKPAERIGDAKELANHLASLQKVGLTIKAFKKSVRRKKMLLLSDPVDRKLANQVKSRKETLRTHIRKAHRYRFILASLLALVLGMLWFPLTNYLHDLMMSPPAKRSTAQDELSANSLSTPREYLLYSIHHDQEEVEQKALEIWIQAPESSFQEAEKILLTEKDWEPRYKLIQFFGDLLQHNPEAIRILSQGLQDSDTIVRWKAVDMFERVENQASIALEALLPLCHAQREHVRIQALHAIANLREQAARATLSLEEMLVQEKKPAIKKAVLKTLRAIGSAGIPGLLLALRDESEEIKRMATEFLGQMGQEAVAPLRESLQTPSWGIRYNVVSALGELAQQTPQAVPVLVGALKDEDRIVRWHAAEVIGKLNNNTDLATKELLKLLNSAQEDYQKLYSLYALTNLGAKAQGALAKIQEITATAQNSLILEAAEEAIRRIREK